jgi:hypothetical protein
VNTGRRLVVFGGRHDEECLQDVRVLDLDTWSWSEAKPHPDAAAAAAAAHGSGFPRPRRGHTAVLVGGNRMLVLGGGNMEGRDAFGDHWCLHMPWDGNLASWGEQEGAWRWERLCMSTAASAGAPVDEDADAAREAGVLFHGGYGQLALDEATWGSPIWQALGHSATLLDLSALGGGTRVAVFGGSWGSADDVFGRTASLFFAAITHPVWRK